MSKKPNTKVFKQRKQKRRQWVSFVRMLRYGLNNFTRNAWLTIAATAVMTITLLIVFVSASAQNILTDSVKVISDKVDMSIYLKTETTAEQADEVMGELRQLSNVKSVRYISAEEARKQTAEDNKTDVPVLEALNEATNKLPVTLRISLDDINDTSQLSSFVSDNQVVQPYLHEEREPSFAGERRDAIEQITGWTVLAQQVGLVASVVFVIISSLIIFNTIRMAIYSRKEEIYMMKLIGADKHFIRGPFIVEAIVYGLIAALFATGIGLGLLYLVRDGLVSFGIDVTSTIAVIVDYLGLVIVGMIVIGAVIGVVSSLFATRRYLKV